MSTYRIYPLDPTGRALPPVEAECADDDGAILFARDLKRRVRHGCEVWRLTTFVGRFHFQGVPARPARVRRPAEPEAAGL